MGTNRRERLDLDCDVLVRWVAHCRVDGELNSPSLRGGATGSEDPAATADGNRDRCAVNGELNFDFRGRVKPGRGQAERRPGPVHPASPWLRAVPALPDQGSRVPLAAEGDCESFRPERIGLLGKDERFDPSAEDAGILAPVGFAGTGRGVGPEFERDGFAFRVLHRLAELEPDFTNCGYSARRTHWNR